MMPFLRSAHSIALVLSARLGDSLLFMSLANNLRRDGRAVTVFSTQMHALLRWFPSWDIQPVPAADRAAQVLGAFDAVVQMHAVRPFVIAELPSVRFSCFEDWHHSSRKLLRAHGSPALLGELGVYAQEVFGVAGWEVHNGNVAPAALRHRAREKRVVIHPTAGAPEGCWPRHKYARLAHALTLRGFTPEFVVEPRDRAAWLGGASPQAFIFVEASTLDELAAHIYESGWFIGSDSGVGHLASACGIATVTICERLRNMRRWKPGWAKAVVAQPLWLPSSGLRRRYWRQAMTVGRVMRAFDQAVREAA
jgi:heptosyltransferase-3